MQQQISNINSHSVGANYGVLQTVLTSILKQHMEHSGEDFNYIDPITNENYVPYCIEPSLGADRVTLHSYVMLMMKKQLEGDDKRTVYVSTLL